MGRGASKGLAPPRPTPSSNVSSSSPQSRQPMPRGTNPQQLAHGTTYVYRAGQPNRPEIVFTRPPMDKNYNDYEKPLPEKIDFPSDEHFGFDPNWIKTISKMHATERPAGPEVHIPGSVLPKGQTPRSLRERVARMRESEDLSGRVEGKELMQVFEAYALEPSPLKVEALAEQHKLSREKLALAVRFCELWKPYEGRVDDARRKQAMNE